jgi:hypothetical protein
LEKIREFIWSANWEKIREFIWSASSFGPRIHLAYGANAFDWSQHNHNRHGFNRLTITLLGFMLHCLILEMLARTGYLVLCTGLLSTMAYWTYGCQWEYVFALLCKSNQTAEYSFCESMAFETSLQTQVPVHMNHTKSTKVNLTHGSCCWSAVWLTHCAYFFVVPGRWVVNFPFAVYGCLLLAKAYMHWQSFWNPGRLKKHHKAKNGPKTAAKLPAQTPLTHTRGIPLTHTRGVPLTHTRGISLTHTREVPLTHTRGVCVFFNRETTELYFDFSWWCLWLLSVGFTGVLIWITTLCLASAIVAELAIEPIDCECLH